MPSQVFSMSPSTNGGAQLQFSAALNVTAGQRVRVRFTRFRGQAECELEIVANNVTSFVDVDDKEAWATGAVAVGDACRVRVDLKGDPLSVVEGILETF